MNPATFEPNDVSTELPAPTDGGTEPMTKQATLNPEQVSAFGLDGATEGDTYTIRCTVSSADDGAVSVTVDSSEPDGGDAIEGEPDMDEQPATPPIMPPKPKPSIRGPKDMNLKL